MKISFYVNDSKPVAPEAEKRLATKAASLGLKVVGSKASPRMLRSAVIIALGGDGTILRCVREHPGIPVLGFNLGGLGYLSSVEEKDFDQALQLLAEGRYRVAERTMLELRAPGHPAAINDLVIVREMPGHAPMLDLSVDGHRATRYFADGLIFATPTGSTAYSLSANGPVVMPDSRALVVTPMNSHALGIRPLVVSDDVRITVTSVARDRPSSSFGVYADGEAVAKLAPGESLEISKSSRVAKFVELEGYDPYVVLAHKLGWTGTSL